MYRNKNLKSGILYIKLELENYCKTVETLSLFTACFYFNVAQIGFNNFEGNVLLKDLNSTTLNKAMLWNQMQHQ